MVFKKVNPREISATGRFRKDYGDLAPLADSIKTLGLLQPIVVDSNLNLIAGGRRLRAIRTILRDDPRFSSVAVNVVDSLDDAKQALAAERDENTCRLDLTPEEKVLLGARIEKIEADEAKKRLREGQKKGGQTGGKSRPKTDSSPVNNGRVKHKNEMVEKVGESVGMSGTTYRKAKEVVESGDQEAIEQMNRTGKVGPAHNRVKQKKKAEELEQKAKEVEHLIAQPEWTLIQGDCVKQLECLDEQSYARLAFADPPYNIGIDYGEGPQADQLDDEAYLKFCRKWMTGIRENLTKDGSFWLLVNHEYAGELCVEAKGVGFHLRSWITWFEGFGVNCTNKFNRTTRFIFHFVCDPRNFVFHSHEVMRPSDRQVKYGDKRAAKGGKVENDMWDIPRLTGTCRERIPGFPTQIPIAIVDRIIRCASDPGDLVIDPFNGSGTAGVAAIQNSRKFLGIDLNQEFIDTAEKRLQTTEVLG